MSLAKAHLRLGGIETEAMNGDNLAVTLCSFFDDGEESEDDTGWSPAAIEGCNQVLEAIRKHYDAALAEQKDRTNG